MEISVKKCLLYIKFNMSVTKVEYLLHEMHSKKNPAYGKLLTARKQFPNPNQNTFG